MTNTPSPTDEDRELIERLRQMHTSLDGYGALTRPINPDGPTAADRLESLLSDRAKLIENAAQIAESHAVCGCNGEHGSCLIDDSPKAIAEEIRALNRSTDRAT